MRHGQTGSNVRGVWSADTNLTDPLTEVGREQVLNTAKKLPKIDYIIVSPFSRTQETAHLVAEQIGLAKENIIVDPRIAEWHAGSEFDQKSFDYYFSVRNASPEIPAPRINLIKKVSS